MCKVQKNSKFAQAMPHSIEINQLIDQFYFFQLGFVLNSFV